MGSSVRAEEKRVRVIGVESWDMLGMSRGGFVVW